MPSIAETLLTRVLEKQDENSEILARVSVTQEESGRLMDAFVSEARQNMEDIKRSLGKQGERVGEVEMRVTVVEEHQRTACPEHLKKIDALQQHLSKIDTMLQEKEIIKAHSGGELRVLRKYAGWVIAGLLAVFSMWKDQIIVGAKAFWSALGF